MALYWPSSFLPFMERDEVEASENANAKTKEANIQLSETEQAWSIENISYGQKENFLLRDQRRKSRAGKIGRFSPLG